MEDEELYFRKVIQSAKNIVVKIGTQVLTDDNGQLDEKRIRDIADQITKLRENKIKVTVVSSGAIGAGLGILGLTKRPSQLARLQAIAAIGQGKLIETFEKYFSRRNLHSAQILLTRADFEDRRRYINIERTLNALHKLGAVPIINENDTVAVDEIRFGDNDLISALVANLIHADLLIILTVVEGLLDKSGNVIRFVPKVDDRALSVLRAEKTSLGAGGMQSKLQSVKLATNAGVSVIIASGRKSNVLIKLLIEGEPIGTLFQTEKRKMKGKKRWLSFAEVRGTIVIDAGAAHALIAGGKSLLPGGIVKVGGRFKKGDVVRIVDLEGEEVGRGVVNFGSVSLSRIIGKHSSEIKTILGQSSPEEVVHRDNLIITAGT